MACQGISFGSFSEDEISNLFIHDTKDLQFVWQNEDKISTVTGNEASLLRSKYLDITSHLDQDRRSYSPEILSPNIPPNPPTSPVEGLNEGDKNRGDLQLHTSKKLNVNAIPFVPGVATAISPGEKNHTLTSLPDVFKDSTTVSENNAARQLKFNSIDKVVGTETRSESVGVMEVEEELQPQPLTVQSLDQPASNSTTGTSSNTKDTVCSYTLDFPSAILSSEENESKGIDGLMQTSVQPSTQLPPPVVVGSVISSSEEETSDSNNTCVSVTEPPDTATRAHQQALPPHVDPLPSACTSSSCDSSLSVPVSLSTHSPTQTASEDSNEQGNQNNSQPRTISGGVTAPSTTTVSTPPIVGGAWGTNRIKSWASIFSQTSEPVNPVSQTSLTRTLGTHGHSSSATSSRTSEQKSSDRGSKEAGAGPKEVGSEGVVSKEVGPGGTGSKEVASGGGFKEAGRIGSNFNSVNRGHQSRKAMAVSKNINQNNAQLRSLGEQLRNWSLSHKMKSIQPRGLINQGNWCYIHAPLQALLSIPGVLNLFLSLNPNPPLSKEPSTTPFIDAMIQFVNEFQNYPKTTPLVPNSNPVTTSKKKRPQLTELLPGEPFRPEYIYTMLHKIRSNLSYKGRQEDAEEFLGCMLDGLHEEFVLAKKVVNDNMTSQEEASIDEEGSSSSLESGLVQHHQEGSEGEEGGAEEEWEQVGPKNKSTITRQISFSESPITEIFGGKLRSALHRQGAKESATMEPFFSLQLDIQSDSITSVKEALDALAAKETVHISQVDAYKRLTLARLPPVLIFHLKRFIFTSSGSQKLFKHIYYTTEMEIAKELLAPAIKSKLSQTQRTYKLWAVVYHHGKMATGGHYTSDVFHSGYGGWVRIDDSILKPIPDEFVLKPGGGVVNKNAYLLFYRRLDTIGE